MAARSSSGGKAVRFERRHARHTSEHEEQEEQEQQEHRGGQHVYDDPQEEQAASEQLPRPPQVPRRMRWRGSQIAGLILISILPGLAVARLLDPRPQVAHASAGPLEVSVSSPTRLRYRMTDWMFVDVRNPTGQTLESVTVEVDAKFVEGFAQASFMPEAARVDDKRYSIDLGRMAAGESRRVSLQVQAEKYGSRAGSVAVVAGSTRASVPIDVFVFP